MPSRPTRPDGNNSLGEMAALAIADNPDLKQQLTRIVSMMLTDVERTFLIGDPKAKAVYVRQVVPTLIRSMAEADVASGDLELRASFERVMAAVRGDEPADGLRDGGVGLDDG